MHHIYHTDAFVLGSRPSGEDSKTLFLYTRELGLVFAKAQGLRKLSSRLRYILQDMSRVHVDLVKGKEIWRVTTAAPAHAHERRLSGEAERILSRIHALLLRLVAGEEASDELFGLLERTHLLLREGPERTKEDYRALELLSVARILMTLGYLSRDRVVHEEDADIPAPLADIAYQHRLIRDINQALAASQL